MSFGPIGVPTAQHTLMPPDGVRFTGDTTICDTMARDHVCEIGVY